PRRRESRPLGSGNIQKSSENLEVLDSRFHGNDEVSDGIVHPLPSFPHKRESKPLGSSSLKGYKRPVIPAQAGIQAIGQRQYSKVV
ncbi:TPA: hypothetical protein ACFNM0_002280, partial [Neisseria lactamica]